MKLLTLGINHHTAPVAIREKVAFDPEFLQEALHDLRQHLLGENQAGLPEATILSTCNRTELYCAANDASAVGLLHEATFDWLAKRNDWPQVVCSPIFILFPNRMRFVTLLGWHAV